MKAIRQTGPECLLAAMCAVAGEDYRQVRVHYQDWLIHLNFRTRTLKLACENLFPPMWPILKNWPRAVNGMMPEQVGTALPNEAINLSGKGILIIAACSRFASPYVHALAFEDWNILDPAVGDISPWLDFAYQYGRLYDILDWHVCTIVRADKNNT